MWASYDISEFKTAQSSVKIIIKLLITEEVDVSEEIRPQYVDTKMFQK